MLDYFKRVVDRIILPQFPVIKSYEMVDKEKINEGYKGLVVMYNINTDYNGYLTNELREIIELTRSCYRMSGIDDQYVLAGIGIISKNAKQVWIWKLGNQEGWESTRDRNLEFHKERRNQNT